MGAQFFISLRYLVTKRKEKFISLISFISVLGVAVGVMALIVVIAVMSGFDEDLRDKIIGNYSHITVNSYQGISDAEYADIAGSIAGNPHVQGVSPYIQGQVLIKEGDRFFAVGLKGVDPSKEAEVTKINKYLIQGKINALTPGEIFVGRELAGLLGLEPGSEILIYSPLGKKHNLKIAGVFNSGMYDYDLNLVFTHLKTAGEIFGMDSRISAIAVKLDDLYSADKVKRELSEALGYKYVLRTWMEVNQNFFAALKLEKLTMFVILTLIILVASLNIISTLSIMIVEKTKDIGILKAIGMDSFRIRMIFFYEGLLIGMAGIFFGVLGGISLCGVLKKYQFIKLPQDIYYIDRLPVSIDYKDIIWVVSAAMAITLISTIYPVNKAAGLRPVEALRYE